MRARAKSRRLITAILGLQATEHKPLQRLIFSLTKGQLWVFKTAVCGG